MDLSCTKRDERPEILPAAEEPEVIKPRGAQETCRVVAALIVNGRSPEQIANIIGASVEQVRIFVRTPLTREFVKELSVEANEDDIVENILQASIIDTIYSLIDLRDSSETPPAVKLAVCKELLDRAKGRPVTVDKTIPRRKSLMDGKDPVENAKQLDEEIASLQQQVERNV